MPLGIENTLQQLQAERAEWAARNFPNADAKDHTLGVCEEAGELAHAVLKMAPGLADGGSIRGDHHSLMAEAADALGDLIIYAAGVATDLGLALDVCVEQAWAQVKERDWNKNRETGVTRNCNGCGIDLDSDTLHKPDCSVLHPMELDPLG